MSRTMTGENAYLRGREAFKAGLPVADKPYLPGFDRAQWLLGLSDAAVEAGRAREMAAEAYSGEDHGRQRGS